MCIRDRLDGLLLPITVVLKIVDEPSIGDAIDNNIADTVDDKIANQTVGLDEYINSRFAADSLNSFIEDRIKLFSSIYKKRLNYVENETGFRGANPPPMNIAGFGALFPRPVDANVSMLLTKRSNISDYRTMLTEKTACRLQQDFKLLEKLEDEIKNTTVSLQHTVASGENLDLISKQYFESDDFAMTIGSENGYNKYTALTVGNSLKIPSVSKLADKNIHYVKSGENIWKIAINNGIPENQIHKVIKSNDLRDDGDTIYPGMLIDLSYEK